MRAKFLNGSRRVVAVVALLCGVRAAWGQARPLPAEPAHDSGQSVTGAYEGWFKNPDGSFSLLFGYFNRNQKQDLDIAIGPDNRLEPGGPDQGQPTHFLPGRQWGVFTVIVPKDFGTTKLTWTLTANHLTTTIPGKLDPLWEISPFSEVGMGNTPPVLRLAEGGPPLQGPSQGPKSFSASLTATVGNPLTLKAWVADDAKLGVGQKPPPGPAVTLTWSKFRGPGEVAFANPRPRVEPSAEKSSEKDPQPSGAAFSGKGSTTATFSEPGEYVLLVVANDWSGDGGRGFQCCWTPAHVKVSVAAPSR
jgi:hypothetical protein